MENKKQRNLFKIIFNYILVLIISIALIIYSLMNIFGKTIFSKDYVLAKLEESNYYTSLVAYVNDSFENYIHQSGLDADVLNDIVTESKIKEDTDIILSNIYDGTSKEISTDEIREKLISNISDSIDGRSFTKTEKKAINSFADTICSTYKDALSHTKYEQKIHSLYEEALNYKTLANKICLIATAISAILMIIFNLKEKHIILEKFGIAVLATGLCLAVLYVYITTKINISGITILSDMISKVVVSIISSILKDILQTGFYLGMIGFVGCIIGSIFGLKEKE